MIGAGIFYLNRKYDIENRVMGGIENAVKHANPCNIFDRIHKKEFDQYRLHMEEGRLQEPYSPLDAAITYSSAAWFSETYNFGKRRTNTALSKALKAARDAEDYDLEGRIEDIMNKRHDASVSKLIGTLLADADDQI